MKKKLIALTLLLCMCLSLVPVYAEEGETTEEKAENKISFSDVSEEHKAYDAIMDLALKGIINGKSKNKFCPDDSLKREEFAKILTSAFELTDTKNSPVFYGVPVGTWYASFVQIVGASKLMTGISETEFGTGKTLSRQDLAVILKRFLDNKEVDLTAENSIVYADNNEISDYAREAVEALSSTGIMPGKEDNCWHPLDEASRAETAQTLYNAMNLQKAQADALGRYGDASQYEGPFEVPTDDRLAEAMPIPFDPDVWPNVEILYEDFEDEDYDLLEKNYFPDGSAIVAEGGYGDNGGCIKVTAGAYPSMVWKAPYEDLKPGDYLVFSCMMKGENISGEGGYRPILSIRNQDDKWLNETHTHRNNRTSHDWKEFQVVLMVPEELNRLSEPEMHNVRLGAYMDNLTGTAYYDNFKLSKIIFNPMNAVLMSPSYKGIIKGENGIGDIALRAYIFDMNGKYDLNNFHFTAQITDKDHNVLLKSESDTVTNQMEVYFSSASLPMGGDYYIESIITDKTTGEQVQKQEYGLHKREADYVTAVGYDEYGRITRKGEPIFPLRVYNYSKYDDATADIIAAGNIDAMTNSGVGWHFSFAKNKGFQDYVKKLEENNVDLSLATGSFVYSNLYTADVKNRVTSQTDLRGLLTKMVNNWKDLPNLFDYYIFDEQNGTRYGDELAWHRKIIEENDLEHPTTCAISESIEFFPGTYAKTSDFLGYDPYPVSGKPTQDLSKVYRRLATAKEQNPGKPIYFICQAFWYYGRGDLRAPNQEEIRNMYFQALCAGACMIDAWAYRWMKQNPSPGKTFEEEWQAMVEVFDEIQYLEPIILSSQPAPYYEIKGGGEWLNHMARRHDGKSYLFTVNNQNSAKNARIYLDGVKEIRGMYSGETFEANENGWFELDWDSYQVEVFEYEQADYKSPHAELTRFNLANCIMTETENGSEFVISNDLTEAEYNATMSDYAILYINDTEVQKSGKLNLEGLTEIKVKVVSEDGRFETEKTYTIKRS